MRLAVVTPIPTPYRDPFWEVVASKEGVELMVIYCAAGKSDRPWKSNEIYSYRREFPEGKNLLGRFAWGASAYWNPSVTSLLEYFRPDHVLVGGYNHPTMLQTIRFCYRKNIPWYLMSESWARRTGLRGWAKDRWLRSLLQTAKGGLPAGQLASLRLKELGIPVERQSQLPNVPDIDRLFALGNKRRVKSGEHKAELGLRANDKVILFAARMIDKKRPLLVLEVLQKLDNPTYKLVMLGDGPMMVNIRDFIRTHKLESQTMTCGFVDIEVVYDWMSIADVFLQPSSETWGVAPIEAVALGCRVIISAETGCAPELSSMPGNTVRVIKRDRESLAASIESILANDFAYTQTTYPDTCWLFRSRYSELASNLTQFLQQS